MSTAQNAYDKWITRDMKMFKDASKVVDINDPYRWKYIRDYLKEDESGVKRNEQLPPPPPVCFIYLYTDWDQCNEMIDDELRVFYNTTVDYKYYSKEQIELQE